MKEERKFYTCTEISKMPEFEKNGLIARLQSDICNKDEECIKLMLKNDALNTSLRAKDSVIEEKDREIERLKNENKNLAESNYVLNDHIDEYEFVIKESDKEKAKLKNDIEHWNKSYAYLVSEYGAVKKNVEKLEKEKDDLDRILHNKIEALEGDIECRKKDLEYKNDQIEDLVKRLDDQRKKIEDLENGDVLPYFIRKVVGEKLKEDPCCWATPAEKRNRIEDSFCKSVPCSEAIKQLEKKVDDIPCVKSKKTKSELDDAINDYIMKSPTPICWNDESSTKAKEAYDYIIEDMKRTRELYDKYCVCKWFNNDSPYDKIAERMMRKYKALRNAGFDHDDAMSLIPVWLDE